MTRPGDRRIGDYEIERDVPDDGAMLVYEATHVVLPRRVLLKVLQPHLAGIRPIAVQLVREACILEALHRPGVPRVYECGVTADRLPWIAIELVTGPALDHELRAQPLRVKDVIAVVQAIAEILAHAHSRGVVHRNVRPSSIVRDTADHRGSAAWLVDWGEARAIDTSLPQQTPVHGQCYRAPELLCGEPYDGRADVFALGVIAYQALTGQLPALPIARRCPTAPHALTRLIDRMLSIDPVTRPSAFEVAEEALGIVELDPAAELDPGIDFDIDAIVQPIEDIVLLTDLSRDAVPEPVRERPRWTPPWDLQDATAATRMPLDPNKRRRSVRDDP